MRACACVCVLQHSSMGLDEDIPVFSDLSLVPKIMPAAYKLVSCSMDIC